MATVNKENIGLLNDKLTVVISKEDYLPNFEKTLKQHSKNANIPGFRKGMVPAGLVKKMYGQSIFTDEVLKSVEKGLFDYLETEKLDIFAQPIASDDNNVKNLDHNNPSDYSFHFEIGLKPQLNDIDLSKATITKYNIAITDADVNKEIEALQTKYGTPKEVDLISSLENNLHLVFNACTAEGEVINNEKGIEIEMLLSGFTKKYQDELMGKAKGTNYFFKLNEAVEEKELNFVMQKLALSKEFSDSYYKITISKIEITEASKLNEEFFTRIFPTKDIKTTDQAKAELKEEMEKYWESQSKVQMEDGLYHYLVDHINVDFPEDFLKKWMLTNPEKPTTKEAIELEFPNFKKSLKWTLISDSLSKKNEVKVEEADIKDFAKNQIMSYMGGYNLDPENAAWMDTYADKMLNDKKFVEETYHKLLTQKTFDKAITQVKTEDKEISIDEFIKLVQSHHH